MLQQFAENIWHATSSFKMLPGAHLPTRMTVVRLADDSLLLHSCIELDEELVTVLESLGRVSTIVVPNGFHHLHAVAAKKRFPGATVFAPSGVERKQPELDIGYTLEADSERLSRDFDVTQLRGAPKLNEWVLRHHKSGAHIATDLLFNITDPKGWLTPLVLQAAGTYGKVAISRITKSLVKDPSAFCQSIEQSIGSGVEHLIMSHGAIVSQDAEKRLRHAMAERFG